MLSQVTTTNCSTTSCSSITVMISQLPSTIQFVVCCVITTCCGAYPACRTVLLPLYLWMYWCDINSFLIFVYTSAYFSPKHILLSILILHKNQRRSRLMTALIRILFKKIRVTQEMKMKIFKSHTGCTRLLKIRLVN